MLLSREDFEGSWHANPRRGTPTHGGSIVAVQCGFQLLVAGSIACGQGDSTGFDAVCVCCGLVTVLAVVWLCDFFSCGFYLETVLDRGWLCYGLSRGFGPQIVH